MKIRIKFAKSGSMRFIGHLDVMRFFQKAIRRAEIDIAYSEGFSPHQIMSFAAPLGVGLSSNGEYLDIEANSVTTAEDMKKRLNAQMVEGMEILSVTLLDEHAKNAMASVAVAEYSVRFREGCEQDSLFDLLSKLNLQEQIAAFYAKPSIPVTKKTKKSEAELDLKPAIYKMSVSEEEGTPVIHMMVDASSSGNIKPGLVMEAFFKEHQVRLPEFALLITREDTYTNIGGEKQQLVPLDAVGKTF